MAVEINVFANSEDELFGGALNTSASGYDESAPVPRKRQGYVGVPIAQVVPHSHESLDRLLLDLESRFFGHPLAGRLIGLALELKRELVSVIGDSRATQLESLELQHEAAIVAERAASRMLEIAKQAMEKAEETVETARQVQWNNGRRVQALVDNYAETNKALLSKADKATKLAEIEAARKKYDAAFLKEDCEFTAYRLKVTAHQEALLAHNETVRVALDLADKIEQLQN